MSRELGDACYNIPLESIYGEITLGSITKLVDQLPIFKKNMCILDIGSGSGYSLCNFAKCFPNNECTLIGIEISQIRADLSLVIIPKIKTKNIINWNIFNQNVLTLTSLPFCDLCFSFDKTFTFDLMEHIVSLQLQAKNLKYIISCHSNKYYRKENWNLVGKEPCRLRGSGQIISFFVYEKI